MFWLIGTAFAVRNLLTLTTLGGFTTGRESQSTGFLGHFSLRQPLALRDIPGAKHKIKFPGARGTLGGGTRPPTNFSPKFRNLLTVCVLADQTPTGGKSQNPGVRNH